MTMPKVHKVLLVPDRLRRPPRQGWSWIDRRFLRHYAPSLHHDSILLYFFLTAVSDQQGLSYWGDAAIAGRLRMEEGALASARDELEQLDLIAYRAPLYQVLSLPPRRSSTADGPRRLREVFRQLGQAPRSEDAERRSPRRESHS